MAILKFTITIPNTANARAISKPRIRDEVLGAMCLILFQSIVTDNECNKAAKVKL
ncbi:hypothetical protein PULV_b0473 [Pseudoalteromonas ulvae UL12]|nr:hypothetical protein [Pseudoalteromonas ulvae UL12]